MTRHADGFPDGYPYDTWYGRNVPVLSGGGMPPDPTCMECDTVLVDIDIDEDGRGTGRCPSCNPLSRPGYLYDSDAEVFVPCPRCKGTASIQPDRSSPPEPCPRCVNEDEGQ